VLKLGGGGTTVTPAAVIAESSSKVWVLYLVIGIGVLAAAWIAARWTYSEHLPGLRGTPLFDRLSPPQVRSVARLASRVGFAPGQTVIKEGDESHAFYVIREGTARVTVRGLEKGTLGPGSYFGEIAVIDGGPRSSTVTAGTALSVLEIPRRKLLALLDRDPSIQAGLLAGLQRHLVADPQPVPVAGSQPITRDQLMDLCKHLRESETADWGPGQTPTRG
jgi:CRP-like cAMP-binding protein